MARGKKETRKSTPEERLLDIWNQQVFMMRRKYPDAEKRIAKIRKEHRLETSDMFMPTPEATEALRRMYVDPTH